MSEQRDRGSSAPPVTLAPSLPFSRQCVWPPLAGSPPPVRPAPRVLCVLGKKIEGKQPGAAGLGALPVRGWGRACWRRPRPGDSEGEAQGPRPASLTAPPCLIQASSRAPTQEFRLSPAPTPEHPLGALTISGHSSRTRSVLSPLPANFTVAEGRLGRPLNNLTRLRPGKPLGPGGGLCDQQGASRTPLSSARHPSALTSPRTAPGAAVQGGRCGRGHRGAGQGLGPARR